MTSSSAIEKSNGKICAEQIDEPMAGGVSGFEFEEEVMTNNSATWCRESLERSLSEADVGSFPSDLYFEALCMCRRGQWTWACTGQLLRIMVSLQRFERDHPLCTMEQSFVKLQELVLSFSCERPPWTVGIFSPEQVQQATAFMLDHHYQHFAAHKFLTQTERPTLSLLLGVQTTEALPGSRGVPP